MKTGSPHDTHRLGPRVFTGSDHVMTGSDHVCSIRPRPTVNLLRRAARWQQGIRCRDEGLRFRRVGNDAVIAALVPEFRSAERPDYGSPAAPSAGTCQHVCRSASLPAGLLTGKSSIRQAAWPSCQPTGKPFSLPANIPACQQVANALLSKTMVIVFVNSKGGVGKSTLAVHMTLWALDLGIATALVDCDKQQSSSDWLIEAEPRMALRMADTPEDCVEKVVQLRQSHDLIIGDGPAGLDDVSRTLLLLADVAILPLTPSILDLRSLQQATAILKYAQTLNSGRPEGRIVLNKMRTRDSISAELRLAAPTMGVAVASTHIRDLQAYRDAAGQATSVIRLGSRAKPAAMEIDALFRELLGDRLNELLKNRNPEHGGK